MNEPRTESETTPAQQSDARPAFSKLWPDAQSALKGIVRDGMLLAIGGFGLCGVPDALIAALRDSGVRDLRSEERRVGKECW